MKQVPTSRWMTSTRSRARHRCSAKWHPNSHYHIQDVNRAGGILSIMKILSDAGLVDPGVKRVDGMTLAEAMDRYAIGGKDFDAQADELWKSAPGMKRTTELGKQMSYYSALDTDRANGCIRDMDHAYVKDGGLAVLKGNIAQDGCVVKTAGVDDSIFRFSGPAKVFTSQEAAVDGILRDRVKSGDVVVITFEGPKGRPGNAGDALSHLVYQEQASRKRVRAHHRRTILRRHIRPLDRPHLAGSCQRRQYRTRP